MTVPVPQPQLADIIMPSLGADMVEGMLVQWLVKPGDRVHKGDIIAVLETHKGAIDMEVYQSGVIAEISIQPVATVPVGTVLAKLRADAIVDAALDTKENSAVDSTVDSTVDIAEERTRDNAVDTVMNSALLKSQPSAAQATTEKSDGEQAIQLPSAAREEPIATPQLASPVVRKIAEQQQIDLTKITGTGPHGAVILKDLASLPPSDLDNKQGSEIQPRIQSANALPKMRNAIAAAMTKSKKEIPHFYVSSDIDMTNSLCWLREMNAEQPPEQRLLLVSLLLKAVSAALLKHPALNGFYKGDQLQPADDIHIGNVISLRQGGLVVPAIQNVDWLSVHEIMRALRDITARSRTGHLRSSELTDATITVTNMGERGADSVFGVIYPPQVAIIGFGKLRRAVQVKGDALVIGDVITACLSVDHRAIDGILAGKFLTALSNQLQQPDCL